jgi:hypothetical protein
MNFRQIGLSILQGREGKIIVIIVFVLIEDDFNAILFNDNNLQ